MADKEQEDTRIGSYQIGEALGKGAFGVVYKGLNFETGDFVAIKRILLQGIPAGELNNLEKELDLLKKLNHENIVQYVGSFRSDKFLNIVLEFIENGSLLGILKKFGKFPETLVAAYIWQVLEGLVYLHKQGVIHRDIKAANILITKEGTVKLADFGVASVSQAKQRGSVEGKGGSATAEPANEVLGSPYWMAPEVITFEAPVTDRADVWALGCTVLELMTGKPPYFDMPQMSAMFQIAENTEHPPYPENISPQLEDFLDLCFERDPTLRSSAEKLLEHKWVVQALEKKGRKKDSPLEKPRKRKPKRKDSARNIGVPNGGSPRNSVSNGHRNILRTHSSSSLGLLSVIEDVTKLEDTLEELRQQVIVEVRNNRTLESEAKRLDKKIALLIKNRITLEEVIKSGDEGKSEADEEGKKKTVDPKVLEGYSKLLYLLQVNPLYLVNFIFFQFEGADKFIENLILTLYGYAYSPREEFLLLQLFDAATAREVKNLSSLGAWADEAQVLIKMVLAYTSRVQEQDFLRSLFGKIMDEILDKKDLNLEYDSRKVYKALIAKQEVATGEVVRLPPDATDEELAKNQNVQGVVNTRVTQLLDICDMLLKAVLGSLKTFPYGLRWIASRVKAYLTERFKDAPKEKIAANISYIFFYRFINRAIVNPEDLEMAAEVSLPQKLNLAAISKVLQMVSNNSLLTGDAPEVVKINKYIKTWSERMFAFFDDLIDSLAEPTTHLHIDRKYLEYTQTHNPVIYISLNELFQLHKITAERIDKIAPAKDDPLRGLIAILGPAPATQNTNQFNSEFSLTLAPFNIGTTEEETDQEKKSRLDQETEKLFIRTKKMICDMIVDSYKDSLSELNLVELLTVDVAGNSKLTVTAGKILENLETLEKKSVVRRKDNYKAMMESIQKDINQKSMMREKIEKELDIMKATLDRLKEKKTYLSDQITAYNNYVKACLEQSVRKKADVSKKAKKDKKAVSKYTLASLVKKGVIVETDVPSGQHNTVTFQISEGDRAGLYEVQVYFASIFYTTLKLQLDELLEKQDNGTYILEVMDGRCKLRINLLIHLLNKLTLS